VPLQNRVDPFGEIAAIDARGTLMGNRGGCMHTEHKTLTNRRWVNRAWIYCVLSFNDRHRQMMMMPRRYTELFFLDEVTALSAGHRPCFECQHKPANEFLETYARSKGEPRRPYADVFDRIAHPARLNGRKKRTSMHDVATLPDGVMITQGGAAFGIRGNDLLAWSFSGYTKTQARPLTGAVEVLTPEPFIEILRAGYKPAFHPSADTVSEFSN